MHFAMAGLRMTSRRNNIRDVMFFAIFTDKNEKSIYTPVTIRKVKEKNRKKNWKKNLKRDRGWHRIRTRSLEHERPRLDHWANEPFGN